MTRKKTGLADFTRKADVSANEPDKETAPQRRFRTRGKGETVAITVRLSHTQWERLHQLALSEGISLQELTIRGYAKLFREKGLPDFDL